MYLPVTSTTTFRMDVCARVVKLFLVIFVVFLLFVPTALTTRVCQNEDIPKMQQACKKENMDFRNANENDDHKQICKRLYDMWFCVARSVPQCFSNYTIFYQSYLHSPHNCQPTPKQFQELQKIRNEGLDKINVVPLETTSVSPTTTSNDKMDNNGDQSETSHETEGEGEKENRAGQESGERNNEEEDSEHSGHKGANEGSSIRSRSLILISFISLVTALFASGGH